MVDVVFVFSSQDFPCVLRSSVRVNSSPVSKYGFSSGNCQSSSASDKSCRTCAAPYHVHVRLRRVPIMFAASSTAQSVSFVSSNYPSLYVVNCMTLPKKPGVCQENKKIVFAFTRKNIFCRISLTENSEMYRIGFDAENKKTPFRREPKRGK